MISDYFNNKKEKQVFKNRDVLTVKHMPETIEFRDRQIMALVDNVRSIDYNSTPTNLVFKGKSATGKTTTVKLFFEEAEKQYDNLICVYINCQLHDTQNKILVQIYNRLLGRCIHNGLSTTVLMDSILKELKDKYLIVCLDEFQNIQSENDLNDLLYHLSRSHEYNENANITVYLVSTYDNSWQLLIHDNVYTVLLPHPIEFPQYTKNEIYHILKKRVELGFYHGVISEKELQDIVDATYLRGDLRYGICRLRELGEEKENQCL